MRDLLKLERSPIDVFSSDHLLLQPHAHSQLLVLPSGSLPPPPPPPRRLSFCSKLKSFIFQSVKNSQWVCLAAVCSAVHCITFLDGITVVFCCNYMLMAMRMQCTCIWLSGIVALCLEIDLLFHFPALKNWNATGLGWPNVLA